MPVKGFRSRMFATDLRDGRTDAVGELRTFETFRDWLREAMRQRKVGIRQLEQYAGVSRSGLSANLKGETLPNPETIAKLAGYFGVEANELLELVEKERTGKAVRRVERLTSRPAIHSLDVDLSRVPPEERERARRTLEAAAEAIIRQFEEEKRDAG
jgi:transcriptional regulator with XRE-family HTH domain